MEKPSAGRPADGATTAEKRGRGFSRGFVFNKDFIVVKRGVTLGKRLLKKEQPPRWLRCAAFAAGALGMGLAAAVAVQWVVTGSIGREVLPWFLEAPGYLFLTALLYGAVIALVGAVTGSLAVSGGFTAAAALTLSLVDYFKNAINGTPLELADFGLAAQLGQVAGVAGELRPPVDFWRALAALALCVGGLAALRRFTRLEKRSRLAGGGISLLLTLLLFSGAGARFTGSLFGVDIYTRTAASVSHDRYGLTLSLWRDCFLQSMEGPEGYSQAYMNQVLSRIDQLTADYQTAQPAVKPNVIMILSESFYDLTRLPDLTFERDPLENFHALEKESISGTFHSHYLGYGTGYIEMSMLEGITGLDFNPGTNLCFLSEDSYNRLDALTAPFLRLGYQAELLHGYNDSLYNRTVTYPRMGFSRLLFSQDIQSLGFAWQGGVYGGYYMKDQYFFHGMLDQMRAINESGSPAFLFGITMENHQPFDAEKFGYACQIGVESKTLSQENMAIVRVMLEGITRADQALGDLVEQLRSSDQPTLVVFFGDHRPNLFMTDGDTVYTKLGLCPDNDTAGWTAEQIGDLYSTDYLIWANDAALLQGRAGTRQESSVTALGPQLLELTGAGWTRWWALQDRISRFSLTDTDLYFADGTGKAYFSAAEAPLSDEERELIELKRAVTYDAFYGKQYITAAMNEFAGT